MNVILSHVTADRKQWNTRKCVDYMSWYHLKQLYNSQKNRNTNRNRQWNKKKSQNLSMCFIWTFIIFSKVKRANVQFIEIRSNFTSHLRNIYPFTCIVCSSSSNSSNMGTSKWTKTELQFGHFFFAPSGIQSVSFYSQIYFRIFLSFSPFYPWKKCTNHKQNIWYS